MQTSNKAGWQAEGALRSLYIITVFICLLIILTNEQEALVGKVLSINNITQQNLQYNLIKVAIKKQDKLIIFY